MSARGYVPNPSSWIARLPQEDLCQASGLPPIQKYEADGGPSIEDVLQILAGSESPEVDRADFVLAQLAFWLLAATDGHAKNISIHHKFSRDIGTHSRYGQGCLDCGGG